MAINRSLVLCLLVLFPLASAKLGWGGCPKQQLVANFDINKYLGDWFEYVRDSSMPFESGECSTAHYELKANGKVKVLNSEVREDGEWHVAEGEAYCDGNTAQCHVRFSNLSPFGDYEVLDTDYNNYTVVYSCTSFWFFHAEAGWVLTRDATFNAEAQVDYLIGKSNGLTRNDLHFTSHGVCPERA